MLVTLLFYVVTGYNTNKYTSSYIIDKYTSSYIIRKILFEKQLNSLIMQAHVFLKGGASILLITALIHSTPMDR